MVELLLRRLMVADGAIDVSYASCFNATLAQ